MSWHWWHVVLSWGGTLGVFAALATVAATRHRRARQALDRLDIRARRGP